LGNKEVHPGVHKRDGDTGTLSFQGKKMAQKRDVSFWPKEERRREGRNLGWKEGGRQNDHEAKSPGKRRRLS